jgi:hypothetical protein
MVTYYSCCSITHSIRKGLGAFLAETTVNGLLQAGVLKENKNLACNNGEEIHVDTESFYRTNFVFTARNKALCIH